MSDLATAIVSGVLGGLVALHGVERQVRIRNVTEERAKWRERIRDLGSKLAAGSERKTNAAELALSLNPFDRLDREIVAIATRISKQDAPGEDDLVRLSLRLQLLLKHDWERAKREADWTSAVLDLLRRLVRARPRITSPDYEAFVRWRERNPVQPDERLPPI